MGDSQLFDTLLLFSLLWLCLLLWGAWLRGRHPHRAGRSPRPPSPASNTPKSRSLALPQPSTPTLPGSRCPPHARPVWAGLSSQRLWESQGICRRRPGTVASVVLLERFDSKRPWLKSKAGLRFKINARVGFDKADETVAAKAGFQSEPFQPFEPYQNH